MHKRFRFVARRMGVLAGAGILLQAGACNVNLAETAQTLLLGTVSNLLTSFVFGMFNIPVSGF
ncbi:MAG: hypothetical protein PVI86_19445 [Phycisphaerae bacterium]